MTDNRDADVDNLEIPNLGYEIEEVWDAMEKNGDGK